MQVAENTRFWLSIALQVSALTAILGYLDSPLPFCYRQSLRDPSKICFTPNSTTCYEWTNKRVHWIEQGLSYRSTDRICTSQMIWLMKALIYAECTVVALQIASRRRNSGITPNGVAFAYFTSVDFPNYRLIQEEEMFETDSTMRSHS
ncbi:hypothetical protein RB195_014676 [Necator americanus]|uniref:Uncharacterized protein n=1 Tax=Necator americanus TaxID=51031 RepID=A0ABR1E2E7_NECAM